MFFKFKNDYVMIGDTAMHYASFGNGERNLIIILGLSEGLKSVKGQALTLALFYKMYAKDYKVFVFGRKEVMSKGYTIKDMAKDQKEAMDLIGINSAYIMGVSLGGMIAQQMAIDYPTYVEKLVIAVSAARVSDTLETVLNDWISKAEVGNYKELVVETMKKTYSEAKYAQYKPFLPIISRLAKPKSFERFIVQAQAILQHTTLDSLMYIKCPTLVIGGDSDQVVGENTSQEIASMIEGSTLVVYNGLGHGAYEETKDFNRQVLKFLN